MADEKDDQQNQSEDDFKKSPHWRNMERKIEKLEGRLNDWQTVALDSMISNAGFDPSDPIVGLVKQEFTKQELDPSELKTDSFAQFAKENYNVEPPQQQQNTQQTPNQPQTVEEQIAALQQQQNQPPDSLDPAQQYQRFQQPADQLMSASVENRQQTQGDRTPQQEVAKAETEGRWGDAFSGKVGITRSLFNQPGGYVPPQQQVNPNTGLPTHTPNQQ